MIAYPPSGAEPVVYIIGDSWTTGTGDSGTGSSAVSNWLFNGEQPAGWAGRLLTDNPTTPTTFHYASASQGKSGSWAQYWEDPYFSYHGVLAAGCTHAIYALGINDISGSRTLAAIQADVTQQCQALKALGLQVIGCTVGPKTTSSDNWATVANQTPATGFGANSVWSNYNAWVLSFPSSLFYAVIDVASVLVNTTSGGSNAIGTVWNPSLVYTGDGLGLHPNTTGHINVATTANVYFATAPSTPVTINTTSLFGTPL